jgi:hypothetical protein
VNRLALQNEDNAVRGYNLSDNKPTQSSLYRYKRGWVAIPNTRIVRRTARSILCKFNDGTELFVPTSQVAPHLAIKQPGDSGHLVVSKWWAEKTGVMKFTQPENPWNRFPHFRDRLREFNAQLPKEDSARVIIKSLCDALRVDLGITQEASADSEDGDVA